jgi:CubicO group peptidase (beta-lactamase class C family)
MAPALAALLACSLAASPAAAPALSRAAAVHEMDELLRKAFPPGEPGAAVLVSRDGIPLLRRGYGLADVEHGVPVTPQTVFRIGSITRQFLAVAVLLLVEEGKLSLGDPIEKHLPGWPTSGRALTLDRLLGHTSGVPSCADLPAFRAARGVDRTVDEILGAVKDLPLEFEPGTRWRESDTAYLLLGKVVEKVAGLPWQEVVRSRLAVPLGLRATAADDPLELVPRRARGYVLGVGKVRNADSPGMALSGAAGALRSTVDDLNAWEAGLRSGKILPPASLALARTSQLLADGTPTRYGLGWTVSELLGRPTAEDGGTIDGFMAYLLSVPDEGILVAVLTNRDGGEPLPATVAADLATLALGHRPGPPRAVPLPPAALEAYLGVYGGPDPESRRTVRREGGSLTLQRRGPGRVIVPVGKDTFETPELRRWRATFTRGPGGTVTGLRIAAASGPDEVLTRLSGAEAPATPGPLAPP